MKNDVVLLTDGPLVDAKDLHALLGWELKPQGLCRSETCVPVPHPESLQTGSQIDALKVAELLDRPALHDTNSGVAAIGTERRLRRGALNDLQAPDFVLPDLDGTPHSLSDHRSKKRLLVAFSSW